MSNMISSVKIFKSLVSSLFSLILMLFFVVNDGYSQRGMTPNQTAEIKPTTKIIKHNDPETISTKEFIGQFLNEIEAFEMLRFDLMNQDEDYKSSLKDLDDKINEFALANGYTYGLLTQSEIYMKCSNAIRNELSSIDEEELKLKKLNVQMNKDH